jgi:hypothetical protein
VLFKHLLDHPPGGFNDEFIHLGINIVYKVCLDTCFLKDLPDLAPCRDVACVDNRASKLAAGDHFGVPYGSMLLAVIHSSCQQDNLRIYTPELFYVGLCHLSCSYYLDDSPGPQSSFPGSSHRHVINKAVDAHGQSSGRA